MRSRAEGGSVKGITYSGIAHFPEHPDADLHGLVRLVIREANMILVAEKLNRAGISYMPALFATRVWQVSQSRAEEEATERHYGELLSCPIALQYLKPENYKPIPKSLLRRKTQCNTAPKVRSGVVAKDFLARQQNSSSD